MNCNFHRIVFLILKMKNVLKMSFFTLVDTNIITDLLYLTYILRQKFSVSSVPLNICPDYDMFLVYSWEIRCNVILKHSNTLNFHFVYYISSVFSEDHSCKFLVESSKLLIFGDKVKFGVIFQKWNAHLRKWGLQYSPKHFFFQIHL